MKPAPIKIGDVFHRLTVIELIKDSSHPKALCRCECGNTIRPERQALRSGKAKSCGCLRRELLAAHVERIRLTPEEKEERRKRHIARVYEWQKNNHARYREINRRATRKFYAAHPERARENCRNRRARLIGAKGIVSKDIEKRLHLGQRGRCPSCGSKLKRGGTHLDHIIPLFKGGKHEDKNLQLLCSTCNLSKGHRDPIEFMQERGFLL